MSKNLVDDFFAKNQGYEVAVFCSFGLNLNFFENYLLKLDGLAACESISVFTDSAVYESFSDDLNNYHPRWLNRKYLLTSIETGRIFHPKLYIMASEKKAQIAIGSANLTREGITSNLEIISLFYITENDLKHANLLYDCVLFLSRLAEYSKSKVAQERIRELVDVTTKLVNINSESDIKFLHNLDKPLIEQIKNSLDSKIIDNIKIISPFYDAELNVIKVLRDAYPDATIEIYLQQAKSNFPINVYSKKSADAYLFVYEGIERYMHGKAILFESGRNKYLFTGSANFTDSALMKSNYSGNIEVGLLGSIEDNYTEDLFKPMNISAERVEKIGDIKTTNEVKESETHDTHVRFILEALEEDSFISLITDNDVSFKPDKLLLYKIDGKTEIDFDVVIDLKCLGIPQKDVYAVQAIGYDGKKSNTIWILRLEKKDGNHVQKKYRRVLNNPFELMAVLNEIISSGDEEELKRFLLTFDIPLDLLLMPSQLTRFFIRESPGNIEGGLPLTRHKIFEIQDIVQIFKYFLDRHLNKLYMHYDNIQLQKLPNFMLIFATFFSMIEFINKKKNDECKEEIVTAKKWAEIRECYNMLLYYIKTVWTFLWVDTKEYKSFVNKVNNKISRDKQKILGDIESIEGYILRDYLFLYKRSLNISLNVIRNLIEIKKKIKVKTEFNKIIEPPIFQKDLYIKEVRDINKLILTGQFYKTENNRIRK
jgi:HKD family nuclease